MPFPAFDRSRLEIKPLAERQHDLDLSHLLPLSAPPPDFAHDGSWWRGATAQPASCSWALTSCVPASRAS
jgi:hypothetical protein